MRVAVVSASRNQREHLKRLIEEHGPKVIGVSGFRDYNSAYGDQKPDVLLIDLDQADDASLARLDRMVEQSKIPILFNESTAIPMMPGPYRDDWVDNLVGKLYGLAQKQSTAPTSTFLNRPRYSNTTPRYAMPKVLVISHSKTRRRVLQIILASHAIKDTVETSYAAGYDRENIEKYDLLLLDDHNVGPEDATTFEQLLSQPYVPVQVCNSSHIPPTASERNQWGMKLAGQLIKLARTNAKSTADKTPEIPVKESSIDAQWGDRIASTLTVVRDTIRSGASHDESVATTHTTSASPPRDIDPAKNTTTSAKPSRERTQTPLKDMKYRPPKNASTLAKAAASKTSNDTPKAATAVAPAKTQSTAQTSAKYAKPASLSTGASNLVDATTINTVRKDDNLDEGVGQLTLEEQDAEITRFFNFETVPELAIEPKHESQQKPPKKSVANGTMRKQSPGQKQTLRKMADSGATTKNSIKSWFASLAVIRQKLPKLFH